MKSPDGTASGPQPQAPGKLKSQESKNRDPFDWDGGVDDRVFVTNLKSARERMGLSQHALAMKVRQLGLRGFQQVTIQRIESGGRPVRWGESRVLMQVLGLSYDDATRELRRDQARWRLILLLDYFVAGTQTDVHALAKQTLTADRTALRDALSTFTVLKGNESDDDVKIISVARRVDGCMKEDLHGWELEMHVSLKRWQSVSEDLGHRLPMWKAAFEPDRQQQESD